MTTKPPLRPASPIDAELAKPHPEDVTEIEKQKRKAGQDDRAENEDREAWRPVQSHGGPGDTGR